jgi:hypothetical protein
MWRKWVADRLLRSAPQQQQLDLQPLAMRLTVLEDRQDKLEGQYKSLRGYVYAKKGLVGPPGEPPPGDIVQSASGGAPSASPAPSASRDELRRMLTSTGRFIPGKPPVHRE